MILRTLLVLIYQSKSEVCSGLMKEVTAEVLQQDYLQIYVLVE